MGKDLQVLNLELATNHLKKWTKILEILLEFLYEHQEKDLQKYLIKHYLSVLVS